MNSRREQFLYRIDWIWRLTGRTPTLNSIEKDVELAKRNLDQFAVKQRFNLTFQLVLITEHYEESLILLQRLIDPQKIAASIWEEKNSQNVSPFPFSTTELLTELSPQVMETLYDFTKYENEIFNYARDLFHQKCIENFPKEKCNQLKSKNLLYLLQFVRCAESKWMTHNLGGPVFIQLIN